MFDSTKELLEQIVEGAGIENLTPDLWERFRTPRSDDDRVTFLHKPGFAGSAEEGTLRPTVAGMLIGRRIPPVASQRLRGEGVPVIPNNSMRLSGREPQYRLIDDAELLLTIHAAPPERPGAA